MDWKGWAILAGMSAVAIIIAYVLTVWPHGDQDGWDDEHGDGM